MFRLVGCGICGNTPTPYNAGGPAEEIDHGKNLGDAAGRAGVRRHVYSSVGGAERHSGIPHFE
jgi:uncharacterized protein YbjT (DUF2867 family)